MNRLPDDIPFERWVEYVFSHEHHGPPWLQREPPEWWNERADPRRTATYVRRLFEGLPDVVAPYSNLQIARGLEQLTWRERSAHLNAFLEPAVPFEERLDGIRSMFLVFERLFAPRCAPVLVHREEKPERSLNRVCFMWWDNVPILPLDRFPDNEHVHAACLDLMRRTLALDSVACQESALHGLGHWHVHHPERVESIVGDWLVHHPDVRTELREYALQARDSQVI